MDASAALGLGTQSQPYARIDYALAQTSTGNGDVLLIAPGDYIDEAIDFGGKAVLVQSTGGAAADSFPAAWGRVRPTMPGAVRVGVGKVVRPG
ncbi:MAG: hypothetical protein R3F17_12530 [Planctomycetota bacterium]